MFRHWKAALSALVLIITIAVGSEVRACPFCSATAQTFSEEMSTMDAVVIAKLVQTPKATTSAAEVSKGTFEIVQVLKGEPHLAGQKTIETIYFGDDKAGKPFLVMGVSPPNIMWSTPLALSERGLKYVSQLSSLPKEGPDRLAFFQDYLEDQDEMLARDAYDEFAKAPYEAVQGLKDRMNHDQLLAWIENTEIPASRRRLYLTMLGVCGSEQDLPMLEAMLRSEDRKTKSGLDALIGCYLTLKGPEGMPLIEELYLKNAKAEYADTYAAIMALRFHGTEADIVPKERILQGLRYMLDRPQLADLVIPDLARWEDWSQMERLVQLFKDADEKSSWVRVPVVNYLRACPLPQAKDYIKELEKVDPAAVKRANTFFPFGPTSATGSGEKTSAAKPAAGEAAAVQFVSLVPAAKGGQDFARMADEENVSPQAKPDAASPLTGDSSSALSGRDDAASPQIASTPSAVAPAAAVAISKPLPNLLLVIGVPWFAGAALMFLLWTILRGPAGHVTA